MPDRDGDLLVRVGGGGQDATLGADGLKVTNSCKLGSDLSAPAPFGSMRARGQAGWALAGSSLRPPYRPRALLTAHKEYRLAKGGAWNEAGRVVPKKDGTQMSPSSLKSQ